MKSSVPFAGMPSAQYITPQIRKLQAALLEFDLGRDAAREQIVNQYATSGEFSDSVERSQIGLRRS